LWESYILLKDPAEIIVIPLYWGFHYEEREGWDFGNKNSERDLLKLIEILRNLSRKFCFLLPLTPAPFLTNGGIPATCARSLTVGYQGLSLSFLDSEENLNKIYTFFEPKVLQAFNDFCQVFADKLKKLKCSVPVYGAIFTYLEEKKEISFFEDRSLVFEQGFSRYLKKTYGDKLELEAPNEEEALKIKFTSEIQSLFESTASSAFTSWAGLKRISFLAGNLQHNIHRCLKSGSAILPLMSELETCFLSRRWVSSSLLAAGEKQNLLGQYLLDLFGPTEIEREFSLKGKQNVSEESWNYLELVSVFDDEKNDFVQQGLMDFLNTNYRWAYRKYDQLIFEPDWIDENQDKIKFFQTKRMSKNRFVQVLKLFLMGQKIIIDSSDLTNELRSKWEIFLIENNLKTQKINFCTELTYTNLGEGMIILYEGKKLNLNDCQKFWKKIFDFIKLPHLDFNFEEDIFGYWKFRTSTEFELNYLDVRRLNLYNPTSYKKQLKLDIKRGFVFMKVIDPHLASAKSVSQKLEIELLPQGKIALDFGHYQDLV